MSSKPKLWLFRLVAVLLGICAGLVAVELFLRWHTSRIAQSQVMSPSNLVNYDSLLGWRLTPGWEGEHRHYDFQVRYRVNWKGFREGGELPGTFQGKRIAVVGDSFTFGLGVNDDQTFIHLLNQKCMPKAAFFNFAVPGFSLDQEAILIENDLQGVQLDEIFLVVYLGNDLLDNPRPVPLQLAARKPYFSLQQNGLELRDSPVPEIPPSQIRLNDTLAQAVLGPNLGDRRFRTRLEKKSKVLELISQNWIPEKDYSGTFELQLKSNLRLSDAILDRIADYCAKRKIRFRLVLLSGKSHVAQPGSLSAQYQDFFRTHLFEYSSRKKLDCISLPEQLRRLKSQKNLYYPNEGHLTPQGHRAVCELLFDALDFKGGPQ